MSDQRPIRPRLGAAPTVRPGLSVLGLRLGLAKPAAVGLVDVDADVAATRALVARGRDALDAGDVDAARTALVSAQVRAPGSRDVLLLQALVQAADGDHDGATASFDRALARFPDDVSLVASKALFLLDVTGDAAAALPLLEEALAFAKEAVAPDDAAEDDLAALCSLLGRRLVEARLDAGDVEGAVAAARDALAIDDEPEARAALAAALYSAGDVDDAAAVVAAAGDPPLASLHLIAGRIAVARGDEAGAARSFARAAALDDDAPVPPRLSLPAFQKIFDGVRGRLPEPLRGYLAAVPVDVVAVADLPRLRAARRSPGTSLLLEGPQRLPGSGDPFDHRPLTATLFARNVELLALDEADIGPVITAVLVESFGAFLGLDVDDDDLDGPELAELAALDGVDDDDDDDDGDED